jgi:uncharacterized protein YndB with AHSA1/START domain
MNPPRDNGQDQGILRFEYELDAPPAKVWRALTIPEFVARWLTAPPIEPGSAAPRPEDANPLPPAPLSLRVIDSEPCQFVRYAWREEGGLFFDNVVTFRLHPNDSGGTTFSIVHQLTRLVGAWPGRDAANSNAPQLLLAA